jgi:Major Facilitator Superfamily
VYSDCFGVAKGDRPDLASASIEPHGRSIGAAASVRAMSIFSVVAFGAVQFGGNVPTPLYRLYQEQWDLSAPMLTTIFAVYPIGLLVALLVVGSLSDHTGRRPVIAAALLLSATAMPIFITADTGVQLMVARIVQGLATGTAASALGAAILDTTGVRGPLINGLTAFLGVGLGAFGSSVLVSYAPAPMRLVYWIMLAAFLALVVILAWMPETVKASPGALASLRPHVVIPPQVWRAFLLVSPVNIAGWALGGFYLSLMPSLFRTTTGIDSPLVGGTVAASLLFSGAGAAFAWHRRSAARLLSLGAMNLSAGVPIILWGVHARSVLLLVVGTLVAGAGYGAAFFGAGRTILPLAEPHQRAGLLSAFYIESYLAFSIPAIAVGLVVTLLGLIPSTYIFGAVVTVLAFTSLVATLLSVAGEPAPAG